MKITIEDRLLAAYTAQKLRLRDREDEDYRAKIEDKAFEKIIAERVSRNLRLGLDKGTNIDLEV
jgi:DNA primase large subunit